MPCKLEPCEKCVHSQNGDCDDPEGEEEDRIRTCDTGCAHYDEINQCCWQAGDWGLCFTVYDGDECHLDYSENDGK